MKNQAVMTAIERRMDWLFTQVISNPENQDKDLSMYKEEISDLHESYMELRGHRGSIVFVHGIDTEVNSVQSIYDLTMEC